MSLKEKIKKYKNKREARILDKTYVKIEHVCLNLEKIDASLLENVDNNLINNLKSLIDASENSLYFSIANSFINTLSAYKETNEKELQPSKKVGEIGYTIDDEDFAQIEPILKKWKDFKEFYQAEYFNFKEEIEITPKIFLEVLQTIEELAQITEKEQRINLVKKRVSAFVEKVKISKEIILSSNFSFMSPFDFEEFIAKLFKKMGYDTKTTSKTGDYGVDVVAKNGFEKVAIQCKKYHEGNNVGNQTVQMLLGSMQLQGLKANKGIVITTSHFTKQAYKQAEGNDIELWDKDILHKKVREYLLGS
jgi:restriction system protein